MRDFFLDVSKAFDKVYHPALVHKLECMGISGSVVRGRTDGRTDGRYQVHYLPRFAVDNQIEEN